MKEDAGESCVLCGKSLELLHTQLEKLHQFHEMIYTIAYIRFLDPFFVFL